MQAPLTSLASASGAKGTLNQVKAKLKDAQAKLSTLTDDAHGVFSTQIHAMKSALTTLQTAVNGDPGAGVSTALDGVTQAESGRAQPKIGSLYGVLDRLTADGLIEPDREEARDGRLRRYFRLTQDGRRALAEEAELRAATARVVRTRLGLTGAEAAG